jgi:hypothetical protein
MAEASHQGLVQSGRFLPIAAILAKHDHRGLEDSETIKKLWKEYAQKQTMGADRKGYIPPFTPRISKNSKQSKAQTPIMAGDTKAGL